MLSPRSGNNNKSNIGEGIVVYVSQDFLSPSLTNISHHQHQLQLNPFEGKKLLFFVPHYRHSVTRFLGN